MNLHAMLATALSWVVSHPAEVTLIMGAIVSTFYNKLAKYPRAQAALSLLAHLGVNVPGVAGAISKLVTGGAAKAAAKEAAKAAGAAVVLLALVHCGAMTAQDKYEAATYSGEQDACVAATPTDKAAIDACRAKVRAKWCAQWAARFDAAVCQ